MLFQLALLLLWASAINCGACDVCDCYRGNDYSGMEVQCGSRHLTRVPKNIPHDTMVLYLYFNDITVVYEDDFNYLKGLKRLFLNDNKLISLDSRVFDELNQLERLDLDQNTLTTLPFNVFKHQVKMTQLYLKSNPLTCSCVLFHTLVDVIPKLKWNLDLLGTCGGNVALNTMTRHNERKFCDACHTCLCTKDVRYGGTYVDCRTRQLTNIPDNIPETTTTLNLFDNSIKTIGLNDFNRLKKLNYLNLSRNKIMMLPKQAFHGISQLDRLSMADNQLKTIESNSFDSLEKLKEVELYGNQLMSLPVDLFKNQIGLEHLDLRDNELQCTCDLYHVMVKVVQNLGDHVSGSCGRDVELSTMTLDNKDKFCGKQR